MIDSKVIKRNELTYINLNKEKGRYEPNQLHLTLLNSSFALKDLLRNGGDRSFDSTAIIANHQNIELPSANAISIEISTRFNYREDTGFYVSQYTLNLP